MIKRITLTEARVHMGAVIKRVQKGERFILEKDGIPVAGLLPVDQFEDYLKDRDPKAVKQTTQPKKVQKSRRVRNASDSKKKKSAQVAKGRGVKKSG
ncbi:MAG: type II toxin-antitoxin system prevent-host-death family antitoxin [Nitrospiraceae bacterium]|nr:type II toxin-antitoxin system prevent-host-death family antitoxin [Nitrospiraceae bacterium]